MNLSDRLISWAQNEEMIDAHYLDHGIDCIEAAEKIDDMESHPWRSWALFFAVLLVVMALSGSVAIYQLHNWVNTLQVENAQLKTRACSRGHDKNPAVFQRERKVIG